MKSKSKGVNKQILTDDKRNTKEYSKELIAFVNQKVMTEGETKVYNELVRVLVEENKLSKPQDLLMLDIAIYDYLRVKRLQGIVGAEGDTFTITYPNGQVYRKTNEASFLLNAVETQFRNMMKDMGLTRSERIKKKLSQETQDFSNFMSSAIVDAEVVEENKNDSNK